MKTIVAARLGRVFTTAFGACLAASSFAWTINTNLSIPIGSTGTYAPGNLVMQIPAGSQGPVTLDVMSFDNTAFTINAATGNCAQGRSFGSSTDAGGTSVNCPLVVNFSPSITGLITGLLTVRCSAVSSAGGAGIVCDGVSRTLFGLDATGLPGAVPVVGRWGMTLLALSLMGWAMLRIRRSNAV
jgi:hypothetical protein